MGLMEGGENSPVRSVHNKLLERDSLFKVVVGEQHCREPWSPSIKIIVGFETP